MKRDIAIGIDLDWPLDHHYGVVRGILDYAKKNNWECFMEPWLEISDTYEELDTRYDGIIARASPKLQNWCNGQGMPLVNVWTNSPVNISPNVKQDVKATGGLIANYFLSRGFQNFAFLADNGDISNTHMYEGFKGALSMKGYSCQANFLKRPETKEDWNNQDESFETWLSTMKFPLALCASYHLTARYFCEWCRKRSILIPEDIAVFSAWSNDLICEQIEPSLSHIKNEFTQVGFRAAELLEKILNSEEYESDVMVSPGELVERRSTDVEPINDRTIAKALRFIWDNSLDPIQVRDVAKFIGMTRRSLERKFKRSWKRTINEEILTSRLNKAQKMLNNSSLSITEIAKKSGFNSCQRMAQVFRKKLGISTKEFREKAKIKTL